MQINAHLDFDTLSASKQNGLFCVKKLMDENGNELSHLVKGMLFHSIEALRQKLEIDYEMPITAVSVQTES